jgi:LytS/YehU family sensor histidine kinase
MKIRFNEKIAITLNYTTPIPNRALPPLLFIPFIENAFKYGISYKHQSFVNLDITIGKERLLFVAKNQCFIQNSTKEQTGSGIGNVRKRMELLYGNRFNLDIIESRDLFTVNLSIPI